MWLEVLTVTLNIIGLALIIIAIFGLGWKMRDMIWSNRRGHEKYIKQARCEHDFENVKQCKECGKIE